MSQTLITVAVALVVIALVTYRQTRWQSVRLGALLRMPLIFLGVGVFTLSTSAGKLSGIHFHVVDAAVIAGELVLGLVAGVLMGRFTEIRTFADGTKSRLRGPGVAAWLGFVALRIVLGVGAAVLGATVAAQPATVFFVVAVIKTAQALVVRDRVERHRAAQPSAVVAVGADR